MATMSWENNCLATFGDLRSRSTLESEMTDYLALTVAGDDWDEVTIFNFCPIMARGKDLGMDISVAVDSKEATRDRRCIPALRWLDDVSGQAALNCAKVWLFLCYDFGRQVGKGRWM
jgi:hypothetical protein